MGHQGRFENDGGDHGEKQNVQHQLSQEALTCAKDDHTRLPVRQLTQEERSISLTYAAEYGKHLDANGQHDLNRWITDAMSGNLNDLASMARPENKASANAFAKAMDGLGYTVVIGHVGDKGWDKDYDAVNIVQNGEGHGIQLTHRSVGKSHLTGYEATTNLDGDISCSRSASALRPLQDALSKRWRKESIDYD